MDQNTQPAVLAELEALHAAVLRHDPRVLAPDLRLDSVSGPWRLPNLSPKMQSGNFSTLVENFPLSKIGKKKKIIPKSHELEHSA